MSFPLAWQSLPDKCCFRCKYFAVDPWPYDSLEQVVEAYGSNPEEFTAFCHWGEMRGFPIPFAWRYATREVVSVFPNEGVDCKTFEPRE